MSLLDYRVLHYILGMVGRWMLCQLISCNMMVKKLLGLKSVSMYTLYLLIYLA